MGALESVRLFAKHITDIPKVSKEGKGSSSIFHNNGFVFHWKQCMIANLTIVDTALQNRLRGHVYTRHVNEH